MEPERGLNKFRLDNTVENSFTTMVDKLKQKFTDHKRIFVAKMVDYKMVPYFN